jgi:hypothetical protein
MARSVNGETTDGTNHVVIIDLKKDSYAIVFKSGKRERITGSCIQDKTTAW